MYLTKHSMQDIPNATRESFKCNKWYTDKEMTGLLRMIKHVLKTKSVKLKMFLDNEQEFVRKIKGLCDASFSSDKDSIRSVTGYLIF